MKHVLLALIIATLPVLCRAGSYTFSDTSDGTSGTLGDLEHGVAYTWGFTNSSLSSGSLSGLESSIASGAQTITGGTLTISNIYDWTEETHDVLYVDVLNGLEAGANYTTYIPNPSTDDTQYGSDPFVSGSTNNDILTGLGRYTNPRQNQDGRTGAIISFDSAASGSTILASQVSSSTPHWTPPAGDPGTFTAYDTTKTYTVTFQLSGTNLALINQYLASDAASGSTAGQVLGLGLGPDCHFGDSSIQLQLTTGPVGVPSRANTALLLIIACGALLAMGDSKSFRDTVRRRLT